ncbi:hypothetical protein [Aneurinibacillus aneurinilyticus]|uniref:hypothetical protein n=1 Tax=Aneurinibacillus aneurinilyticus TaxID=1391 RepID=UPI003526A83E
MKRKLKPLDEVMLLISEMAWQCEQMSAEQKEHALQRLNRYEQDFVFHFNSDIEKEDGKCIASTEMQLA